MTKNRPLVASVAGLAVTFGLFFLMQKLIEMREQFRETSIEGKVIDFVRLKEDSEIDTKKRRLPQKQQEAEPPPPPDIDLSRAPRPEMGDIDASIGIPNFGQNFRGGQLGPPSDMDVIPLVRIQPQYPRRAQQLGIEGWVLLEFTITPAGTVKDAVVVDSEPPRIFDRAALRAVGRFKYKPKIEDGVPVERPGVQIVLNFELEDQ